MVELQVAKLHLSPSSTRRVTLWAASLFCSGMLLFSAQRHWLGLEATAIPTALRGALPSFIHTYVFVLIASAWLARSWRQAIVLGLTFWGVDVMLELLQQPALHETLSTPRGVRQALISTFDPLDLLAMTVGMLAAWASLSLLHNATGMERES